MSGTNEGSPLRLATQGVRDAARYLIVAFGAIGGVLVGGLSFTALPSAEHPWIAALAVGLAVLALAFLIGLAVSVLTPGAVTLGGLARMEESTPNASIIKRLKRDKELFLGQGPDLKSFHRQYVSVLQERADRQEEYLRNPGDGDLKTATQVAASRAVVLDEAVQHVLETANFFRVEELFSPTRRRLITGLALFVVAMAGVFAWASAEPASPTDSPTISREKIWLEHLVATSTFRIERLEREREHASTPAAQRRTHRALISQRAVRRREQRAIRELPLDP